MPTEITSLSSRDFDITQAYHGVRFIDSGFTPVSGEKYTGFIPIGGSATVTFTNDRGGDNASGEAISEGVYFPGLFSVLTVSSGKVVAIIAGPNES